MKKIGLNELRKMYLDYFKERGHYVQPSFSLVPEKDKSLLLINAGMAPLKPYFMGTETPPSSRITTCQKCIRTGDIENVGHTSRHATFFEMLGNFSFGDYFKREAIWWSWDFITKELDLPLDKLWVTVYIDDNEAYDIWKDEIGVNPERIVHLGRADNFWEIGVGPCGPCSEIYFDRGEKYGCDNPDCKPGCECDRYIEFWNLVFTQYSKDEEGNYNLLPNPNIDTGMGLERIACIVQGEETIFEVDTLKHLITRISEKAGIEYLSSASSQDISVRIITDHIRSVVFLVSDGVMPSNEGRGYVLRRLLRRAARHAKLIGIDQAFLTELAEDVITLSEEAYPVLRERQDYIKKIISIEEERFQETLDQGTIILNQYISELEKANEKELSGEQAFKLYDTYGFPLELTEEILEEKGCFVNKDNFNTAMEAQKNMSRTARKSSDDIGWHEGINADVDKFEATEFNGYESLKEDSKVLLILSDNEEVTQANEGDNIRIILEKTPFYAESGGQAGDKGIISNDNLELIVFKCEKHKHLIIHDCVVKKGSVKTGDEVKATVNRINRNSTSKNHTATHLLHRALKSVLGGHVEQAGSLVNSERLRFDFTHFESISKDELNEIESIVNTKIAEGLDVFTEEMDINSAKQKGATALFGEKYDDLVRVVCVDDFSMELCGGTHVSNSASIGSVKITSENGVAAGVRRIEAITGIGVYNHLNELEDLLNSVNKTLKSNNNSIVNKVESLNDDYKAAKKELEEMKKDLMVNSIGNILEDVEKINGVSVIAKKYENVEVDDLRNIIDSIKEKTERAVVVFASENNGKVMFIVAVTDDLLDKGYHAGNIIKEVAKAAGGGGGGKANMAQAGGKDASKIDEALEVAKNIVRNITI